MVVGIDIGGARKGSHAVALENGRYHSCFSSNQVHDLVDWCRTTVGAQVIAIDAPCRWSQDGRARPCERELMQHGIACFASTTRAVAVSHPTNYYGWMLEGQTLYQALETTHPLIQALPIEDGTCCFETFPHAITWKLQGGRANARNKRTERRQLLQLAKIDHPDIKNMDLVDAALCALTAHHVANQEPCDTYGQADTGFIIVPTSR